MALEPEPHLREKARQAGEHARVRVSVGDAAAYPLPLEASSVDGQSGALHGAGSTQRAR
jgi:hypothetical protein